jgi:hypothetical protein
MGDADRRLDALAYSLGWLVLIAWLWLMAAWTTYLGRLTGRWSPLPVAWWPSAGFHLAFIAVAKLMVTALTMTWIGVLLYRRRLRRT